MSLLKHFVRIPAPQWSQLPAVFVFVAIISPQLRCSYFVALWRGARCPELLILHAGHSTASREHIPYEFADIRRRAVWYAVSRRCRCKPPHLYVPPPPPLLDRSSLCWNIHWYRFDDGLIRRLSRSPHTGVVSTWRSWSTGFSIDLPFAPWCSVHRGTSCSLPAPLRATAVSLRRHCQQYEHR